MSLKRGKFGSLFSKKIAYVLSIGTEIDDLGWPWTNIMHYIAHSVHLSEPIRQMSMKIFIYLFYYMVYTHVKSFTIVKSRKCGINPHRQLAEIHALNTSTARALRNYGIKMTATSRRFLVTARLLLVSATYCRSANMLTVWSYFVFFSRQFLLRDALVLSWMIQPALERTRYLSITTGLIRSSCSV